MAARVEKSRSGRNAISAVNRSGRSIGVLSSSIKGPLFFKSGSNFSSPRPYRNGNTTAAGGAPRKVTKSLWRNILLIHVRLYNPAHFYSASASLERGREPQTCALSPVSLCIPLPLLSNQMSLLPRLNNYRIRDFDIQDKRYLFGHRFLPISDT